jgi:acetyl esterase
MSRLHQPYRALIGLGDAMARSGIGPSTEKVLAQPASKRQQSKPPFWMTRSGDRSVQASEQLVRGRGGPVRVRTYLPPAAQVGSAAIVYIHGGGFVLGGLDACDYITRGLAARTGFPVFSVEYRLAPDCPFPGALEDCEDVLRWVADSQPVGIDPTRIAIAGDSAGGNLAAALTLVSKDSQGPAIRHQTLIYPVTDGTCTSATWTTNGGRALNLETGLEMIRLYAPRHPADHPLVSPLHAPDLADLPPALVITAEKDVLHDDGRLYAERLQTAGVPVVYRDFAGVPHGFLGMSRLGPESDQALDLIATQVTAYLDRGDVPS